MAAAPDTSDAELDALYGLPLDEFVPARDQLVRRLRGDGDRAAAERAKQLRKPSVAAWALNQVSRRSPELLEALLAAGEELRVAQNRLLEGGEHGPLREAAATHRSALEEVARRAEQELEQGAHASGATIETKLFETLQAATRDQSVGELLRAGRLLREAQISDLGLGDAIPAPERPPPKKPPRKDPALARKRKSAQRRLERAQARQAELEEELRAAAERTRDLERQLAELDAS